MLCFSLASTTSTMDLVEQKLPKNSLTYKNNIKNSSRMLDNISQLFPRCQRTMNRWIKDCKSSVLNLVAISSAQNLSSIMLREDLELNSSNQIDFIIVTLEYDIWRKRSKRASFHCQTESPTNYHMFQVCAKTILRNRMFPKRTTDTTMQPKRHQKDKK